MKVSNKIANQTGAMPNAEAAKTGKASGVEAALDNKAKKSINSETLSQSARVDVSPKAQQIAKARELATPNSGIDDAKVARLQKLIDEGNYKVDADAIAERMLDEHMKMPT